MIYVSERMARRSIALAVIAFCPLFVSSLSLPLDVRRSHIHSLITRAHTLSYHEIPRDTFTESAWNGKLIPGSNNTEKDNTAFLPFYVPDGSFAVDDADPRIAYEPKDAWKHTTNSGCYDKTLHTATTKHSNATFSFTGTGVEWFGSTSPEHSTADIYMDSRFLAHIDGYSATPRKQQRFFGVDNLKRGRHILKIVHTGATNSHTGNAPLDIDALVVNPGGTHFSNIKAKRSSGHGQWSLVQAGNTKVAAMQLSVISETEVIIIDKVEHNTLTVDGHPAWGAVFNLNTHDVRPLNVRSNSFCAGGTFLANGTFINVGGNPVVVDKTGAADFGDVNGIQAVRIFTPCPSGDCDIYENAENIRLASARWYNSLTRLDDGAAMIIGGSVKGGWMNNKTTNNPTIEYFPPKNINGYNGTPVLSSFLAKTLNSNLFPIAFTLPDGTVFIAANNDAMIYDWRTNTETLLPKIPNGVRVTYPMTGTGILLPLSAANNYTPEILLCGGSSLDDTQPGYDMSSQDPASDQCSRIVLSSDGISNGWEVEQMPEARIMPDAVLLPDGRILIVNGGKTGIAGYGNVKNQVGQSNADNPAYTPVLYDPTAPSGQRFSTDGMPTSNIPRLYHSVATLTPNGTIMIAGSNPNLDRSTTTYQTEYRVEWLWPDYMFVTRPTYTGLPAKIGFGANFNLAITIPAGAVNIQGMYSASYDQRKSVNLNFHYTSVSLMDLGFVTHAVHMNSRLVILASTLSSSRDTLAVTGPPNEKVYPPGPGWIYVVVDGIPSFGHQSLIGSGEGPPVDNDALAK
jgi:hypothetical protein